MHVKISSSKLRPFCAGGDELNRAATSGNKPVVHGCDVFVASHLDIYAVQGGVSKTIMSS